MTDMINTEISAETEKKTAYWSWPGMTITGLATAGTIYGLCCYTRNENDKIFVQQSHERITSLMADSTKSLTQPAQEIEYYSQPKETFATQIQHEKDAITKVETTPVVEALGWYPLAIAVVAGAKAACIYAMFKDCMRSRKQNKQAAVSTDLQYNQV